MSCRAFVFKSFGRSILSIYVVLISWMVAFGSIEATHAAEKRNASPSSQETAKLMAQLPKLMKKTLELSQAKKYKEAIAISEQISDGFKRLGMAGTPLYFSNLRFQATLYYLDRNFERSAAVNEEILAFRRQNLGPVHADVAESLADLSDSHIELGKLDLAESELQQALAIRKKALPLSDPAYGFTYVKLGGIAHRRARYDEAERYWKKALELFELHLPADHMYIPLVLNNLAEVHKYRAEYDAAETLLKRALKLNERHLKDAPQLYSANLNNLAGLSLMRGDFEEAEKLQRQELSIVEKEEGLDHLSTAKSLNNLALIIDGEGRSKAAVPLFRRALAIAEKVKPVDRQAAATYMNNLAHALSWSEEGRPEAEQLFLRSLKIRQEVLGPRHLSVAVSQTNLAALYLEMEDFQKMETYARKAVAIYRSVLSADHPDLALGINNLAIALDNLGRSQEALRLHEEALAIRKKALGPDHPNLAINYNNLGGTALDQHRYKDAYANFEKANSIWLHRIRQRAAKRTGPDKELQRYAGSFLGFAWSAYEIAANEKPVRYAELRNQAFESVQWAQGTRSGAALARYAARVAAGSGPLAELVRRRQDLANRIEALDDARLKAATGDQGMSGAFIEKRLGELQNDLKELDARLASRFPDYASLIRPHPLSLKEVQKNIGPDAVLYTFVSTRGGSFVFLVTDKKTVWQKIAITTKELEQDVKVLRCGLDSGQWYGEGYEQCRKLVGKAPRGPLLPYDLQRAHRLYELLFAPFADLIDGKELLFVSSGALSGLPIQALVMQPPALNNNTPNAYREAKWFANKTAVTTLPAVSSLIDLGRSNRQALLPDGFLAVANPLLDGSPRAKAWEIERAKLARQITSCDKASLAPASAGRNIRIAPVRSLVGGLADPALLRAQMALPETADEVCRVSSLLHRNQTLIMLGKDAIETRINQLNRKDGLRKFGIVHFATHGALAGEVAEDMEPGLILTPPKKASRDDDGYLAVSEIAELKLNADWVILSACNTAAGDDESHEVLSGLARAFFYAGARSLLVSHWAVDSQATVALITGALKETSANEKLSKSEALRRSMVKLMQSQPDHLAHPSYWAPFILAGQNQ